MDHSSAESWQAIRNVPPVLSQRTAARLSGLSRRQIENLLRDGRLVTLQIGPRRMVSRCSLDALLRELHDGITA
jgi:hypothetical protein